MVVLAVLGRLLCAIVMGGVGDRRLHIVSVAPLLLGEPFTWVGGVAQCPGLLSVACTCQGETSEGLSLTERLLLPPLWLCQARGLSTMEQLATADPWDARVPPQCRATITTTSIAVNFAAGSYVHVPRHSLQKGVCTVIRIYGESRSVI